MSQAPAMPVFTDALIGDTTHLSAEEFGAYCLILFATWRNNGVPFDDNDLRMSRICRCTEKRWIIRLRPILVSFFDLSNGAWFQKRLQKEWIWVENQRGQASIAGKASARARALKSNNTPSTNVAPPWEREGQRNVNPHTHTHTHTQDKKEEESSLREPKKRGTRWLGNVSEEWVSEAATIRADSNLPTIDAFLEAVKFADFWLGSGKTKLNWHATWRNWVRNARTTTNGSTRQSPVEKLYEGAFRAAERWDLEHGTADIEPSGAVVIPLLDGRRSSGGA